MKIKPLEKMRTLKNGQHACLFYDGQEELVNAVVPYLQEGLARGERCVYLSDPMNVLNVRDGLTAAGTKVTREVERGALVLMSERTHLVNGRFDVNAMLAMLDRVIADAIAAGFSGVCGSGDAMWELGTTLDLETFMRYEAALDKFFQDRPITALCLYRRQNVPPGYLGRTLHMHDAVVLDGHVCLKNRFFNPSAKPGRLQDDPFDPEPFHQMCASLRGA